MDSASFSDVPNSSPRNEEIATPVSQGRFDENLTLMVNEIMMEVLKSLDWWAGQFWWFLPGRFEPSAWQLNPNAPLSLKAINSAPGSPEIRDWPELLYKVPTVINILDATWLPNREELKKLGVRQFVVLDIVADDRPSVRLVFIGPTSSPLTLDANQFLIASALLLPKMVVRERVRTELHFKATHDPLTGLLNRRGLNQLLELSPSARKLLRAVLFIDLDKFKVVNDTFGHHIGDELLIQVANRIVQQIRPTDSIARLGGDEFVIVAAEMASSGAATVLAERIWEALAQPFKFSTGETWHGSGSIGLALWQPGEAYADVLRQADMQMYFAKKSGNRVSFEISADQNVIDEQDLEPIRNTRIESLGDRGFWGTLLTVETFLRSPDSVRLGELIGEKLDLLPDGPGKEIWLSLPKSFWLDGERITTLLEQIAGHTDGAKFKLVIVCETASDEVITLAQEIKNEFPVGFVLNQFGLGSKDFQLLERLSPSALIIDPILMQPNEIDLSDKDQSGWVIPRSILAMSKELGISAVAPLDASANQLKIFSALGCQLVLAK